MLAIDQSSLHTTIDQWCISNIILSPFICKIFACKNIDFCPDFSRVVWSGKILTAQFATQWILNFIQAFIYFLTKIYILDININEFFGQRGSFLNALDGIKFFSVIFSSLILRMSSFEYTNHLILNEFHMICHVRGSFDEYFLQTHTLLQFNEQPVWQSQFTGNSF